jgi:hypothetical protein
MVDGNTIDFFPAWDLAEVSPPRHGQPRWEIGNWSDDLKNISGTAREVNRALVDEDPLEGSDFVGIQTCERQDSQAQSIGFKFAPRGTPNSIDCVFPKFSKGRITRLFCFVLARLAYSESALITLPSRIFFATPLSIQFPHTGERGSFLALFETLRKDAQFLRWCR